MSRIVLLFLLVAGLGKVAWGQRPLNEPQLSRLNAYQDTLKELAFKVINSPDQAERYESNAIMVRTLVRALQTQNSYTFNFDSLKSLSIQKSPDNAFRLFTWHVMNRNGTYRFYGAIQMNSSEKLQLHPLVDYSSNITSPQDTVLDSNHWLGSQYYKIVPVTKNTAAPYYVLLGWKGNNVKSTKKVIEVLHFKNGKPVFGMPVFEGKAAFNGKHRIVFEYSRSVSMMLNYEAGENRIVFDHLAAPAPEMENNPALFGPDLSYDGLKLVNGRWKLTENIELSNQDSEIDDLYIDPRRKNTEIINKLR